MSYPLSDNARIEAEFFSDEVSYTDQSKTPIQWAFVYRFAEVFLKPEATREQLEEQLPPKHFIVEAQQRGDETTVQVIDGQTIEERKIKKADVRYVRLEITKLLKHVKPKDEIRINVFAFLRTSIINSHLFRLLRENGLDPTVGYQEPAILFQQEVAMETAKSKRTAKQKTTKKKRAKREEVLESGDSDYDDEL